MCWDVSVLVKVLFINENLVHMYIECVNESFFMTCVYGKQKVPLQDQVWKQITSIYDDLNQDAKWVLLGDFNQVLYGDDKLSFKSSELYGAEALKDCLDYCSLLEMPPNGQFMTWTNNRKGDDVVWKRLDRCFVNANWLNHFNEASLINYPIMESDHGMMVLNTSKLRNFSTRPYRFEAMWLLNEGWELGNSRGLEDGAEGFISLQFDVV